MTFGDVKLNMIFDDGFCRCHGRLSPVRTPHGDIARVTDIVDCIYQRIGIWLATKKGERPLHPNFGCCIRDYINEPLTVATLKALRGHIEAELKEIFPEFEVRNVTVSVQERNTIEVRAYVGDVQIQFAGNEATLSRLNAQLREAMKDLKMVRE